MRAEIISIGTELLLGHIVNTNAAFLSQRLAELGIDVYHHTTVGDNPSRLTVAIKQALARSDIVITSGGLGPTVDDITAGIITDIVGRKGARRIRNMVGSAPGMIARHYGKTIVCLPGPPRELEPMFVTGVVPHLRPYRGSWTIRSRTIKIMGLAESRVNGMVKDLLRLKPPTTVGIYAKLGEVDLKIMSKAGNEREADRAIIKIEGKIRSKLKDHIFGYDDETLEGAAAKLLTKKRLTVAVAESCTGGLVSSRLTNVSGSSKYFIMGLTAYSNEVKKNILCVDPAVLKKHGAVSKQVASQMAVGIGLLAGTDIGVGITGIAGPAGGAKTKPVGLVYVALARRGRAPLVKEFRFRGSREEIKFQASQVALDLVRKQFE